MARVPSPENPSAISSMASTLRAYSIPLFLFTAAMFFQLFIIPRSFRPSHYDVLRIKRYSSTDEVTEAYEKQFSEWNSSVEVPSTIDFIKMRYAFELLSNQIWKRDYDTFGIDEQIHLIDSFKEQYAQDSFPEVDHPLLEAPSFDPSSHSIDVTRSEDFHSKLNSTNALLVQVFSIGSNRCRQFSYNWRRIASLLDGVASTVTVELGDVQLATYLAEKKSTAQPFFRYGLPSLVAFPPGCKTSSCFTRYAGELSIDAVTDWFATTILNLPRIPYYSKESLVQKFLGRGNRHKVKVIFISKTGERAIPFVRQVAKNYWAYASFACVVWQEHDSSFWWNVFGVESAPAIVFVKDPGVNPVVYHGSVNNSWFINIVEQNKYQVLPQLRSVTSMELGCDARGYSRAGNDTNIWYCVVLAGRQSLKLDKMRETLRRLQDKLSNDGEINAADQDPLSVPSAIALKEKRLTFTWLDGEAQKHFCFFYLHSENSYETCGPRRDITDVPQLFIIRYKRPADSMMDVEKPKNKLLAFHNHDVDPASQLVARYNGSAEIPQIIQWISEIIEDGDSSDLPFFRAKTPELVPEDADSIWTRSNERVLSTGKGMSQRISSIMTGISDHLGDPRIGPILLLAALMSSGSVWMRRSQSTNPNVSSSSSQPNPLEKFRSDRRRQRNALNQEIPPSVTDVEPNDATQMPFSDSDADY